MKARIANIAVLCAISCSLVACGADAHTSTSAASASLATSAVSSTSATTDGTVSVDSADGAQSTSSGSQYELIVVSQSEFDAMAEKDYTNGRSTAFLDDPELVTEQGCPTVHAIIELEGWQLQTLLQREGYGVTAAFAYGCEWASPNGRFSLEQQKLQLQREAGDDTLVRTALMTDEIAELPAGDAGTDISTVMQVKGFSSSEEVLQSVLHCETVSSAHGRRGDETLAIVRNSLGNEYLVAAYAVTYLEEGSYTVLVFTPECVAQGDADDWLGTYGMGTPGSTIEEVFATYTGSEPGTSV